MPSGAASPTSTDRRRIGLTSAIALVIGNMVGVGVFTTSGFALADLGRADWVLLAWGVGGLLATCGALSYGALARRFPESGGEYTLLSRSLHPLAGFLAGWVSLLAGFTAPIAAAALALEAYTRGSAGADAAQTGPWIGSAAILAAGAMHGLRMRRGLVLQNAAVALKLLAIGSFIAIGWTAEPRSALGALSQPASNVSFDPAAFAITLVWISFAYSGWNAAVYVAGEVRAPERNLHLSLWLATGIVTLVYVALNAVFLGAAPAEQLAGVPEIGALAAEAIGGSGLRRALSALVALALFTSISAMVMAGPRVYSSMARDGALPAVFARADDVPGAAVALQVGLALVVVWSSDLVQLLSYIGLTLGLSTAATVCGLFAVRRREGALRVPAVGYPWIPGVFVAGTLLATAFSVSRQPLEAAAGLLTLCGGIPLYFWLRREPAR